MKALVAPLLALFLAMLVTCLPAYADGMFSVANTNKQLSIQRVWFAHAGESDVWKPGSLDSPIHPGGEGTFVITTTNCFFDVRVEFSDGYRQTFGDVNVCRGVRLIAS